MIFENILKPIGDVVSTVLKGKQAVSAAKAEAAIVGIKAAADVKVSNAKAANVLADKGQTQDYNLDYIAMQQMEKSYLDEIMIAILLVPIAASFMGYHEEVKAAFDSFKEMPDWYQYLLIGVYIVKFGLRGILTKILSGKFGNIKLK